MTSYPVSTSWTLGVAVTGLAALFAFSVPAFAQGAPAAGVPPARPSGAACSGGGICNMGRAIAPLDDSDNTGFTQIFDGKTLTGWDGDPAIWRVQDGSIYAESTTANASGNTFLIWRGGEPANFEVKFESKWVGAGNGGMQIRSKVVPYPVRSPRAAGAPGAAAPAAPAAAAAAPGAPARPPRDENAGLFNQARAQWNLGGPQLNIQVNDAGSMYEMFGRGWITGMGNVVHLQEGKPPMLVAHIAPLDDIMKSFKPSEWNQYHIIASGNVVTYIVNGQVTSVTIDDDYSKRSLKGLIGIEIESRGDTQVYTRNIWLKNLPPSN